MRHSLPPREKFALTRIMTAHISVFVRKYAPFMLKQDRPSQRAPSSSGPPCRAKEGSPSFITKSLGEGHIFHLYKRIAVVQDSDGARAKSPYRSMPDPWCYGTGPGATGSLEGSPGTTSRHVNASVFYQHAPRRSPLRGLACAWDTSSPWYAPGSGNPTQSCSHPPVGYEGTCVVRIWALRVDKSLGQCLGSFLRRPACTRCHN